jgi:hypothetical protein
MLQCPYFRYRATPFRPSLQPKRQLTDRCSELPAHFGLDPPASWSKERCLPQYLSPNCKQLLASLRDITALDVDDRGRTGSSDRKERREVDRPVQGWRRRQSDRASCNYALCTAYDADYGRLGGLHHWLRVQVNCSRVSRIRPSTCNPMSTSHRPNPSERAC